MADNFKRLLIEYNEYYNILREKEAFYAGNVPPDLHNLIRACNQAIALIKQAIQGELRNRD